MKKILLKLLAIVILLILDTQSSFAAYQTEIPKVMTGESRWIFEHANACLMADNIHRINANGECLAVQTYYQNNQLPNKNSRLLVFIHGDGIPGGGPSDYLKYQATRFISPNTIAVVLIRPGYYDSYNNYSTGESHAFDCGGYPCDGYRPNTVATLAASIQALKNYYHPSCTILVGHSGGAMMSGVILGKYPNLANGAVLASVTYDVHDWAKRHGWGSWPNSLSPNDWVNKIPKDNFIYIISGTSDKDTYPELAKKYDAALKNTGIVSHFISVASGTHNSIVNKNTVEFYQAINDALSQCKS